MNCNDCEHFISPDTCAWGKNPSSCGRNYPTLEDVYDYDARVNHCHQCQHFRKVGGHANTIIGECPHRNHRFTDESIACEHFNKQ